MATTPALPQQLYTVAEVAAILRLSPRRIRDLVADGHLLAVRLTPRGHMRFWPEDVERLCRREPSP
jgi:excisionase family DNA binding protein